MPFVGHSQYVALTKTPDAPDEVRIYILGTDTVHCSHDSQSKAPAPAKLIRLTDTMRLTAAFFALTLALIGVASPIADPHDHKDHDGGHHHHVEHIFCP